LHGIAINMKKLLCAGIFCATVSMAFAQNQRVKNTLPASQKTTLNTNKSVSFDLVQDPNDRDYTVLLVRKTGNTTPNNVIIEKTPNGGEIWKLQDGTIVKIVDASSKKAESKQARNTKKPQERNVKTTPAQPKTQLQRYEESINDEMKRLKEENARLQELQRQKSEIDRLKAENAKLQELQKKKNEIERLKEENAKLRNSLGQYASD